MARKTYNVEKNSTAKVAELEQKIADMAKENEQLSAQLTQVQLAMVEMYESSIDTKGDAK